MTPYLNEDYAELNTRSDIVLVNMWHWASPANPSNIAVKRVIALPGDRVTTREPCPKPSQIIPFNHVWLEGDVDDPRKSLDSNTYGPVSISLITGRVVAVLWPRMRTLKWWQWDKAQDQDNGDSKEANDGGNNDARQYGKLVRERVFKEAVKVERPYLD
ncbi:hypothetical protein Egran_06384 [Elaphomyces granulatus]|uniref:Mitochondrial inner membrane protease subunit 2 n=1 Tax=Elaphomyces granulatus TaxID=519963 RepID=A0A232LNW1_9EURO|nr:hypothetical protein Egran_06384 [Elaphomyces granulatus]